MPIVGAVADRAKSLIPVTWDALSGDPRAGDGSLQLTIDLSKENTFGAVIDPTLEDTYPLVAIDYAAKMAVIEIAQAGIDFWMNQSMSVNAIGTNESLSYVDRANQLSELRQTLLVETRQKQMQVSKLVGYYIDNGQAVPQMSSANINPFHLTPSPEEFPRPYKQTQYS
jgi:hypothetical protein